MFHCLVVCHLYNRTILWKETEGTKMHLKKKKKEKSKKLPHLYFIFELHYNVKMKPASGWLVSVCVANNYLF